MAFINKILVPVDFSGPAANALKYAVLLAEKTQAEIIVLHIYNVPVVDPYMPGETMEVLLEEVQSSSDKSLRKLLAEQNYPHIRGLNELGFVTDDIVACAQENAVDLIVMGTTGASGMQEAIFGSNASGVMLKSSIKVLAVPENYTALKSPEKICYASDYAGHEELQFLAVVDLAKIWGCTLHVLHVVGEKPEKENSAREIFQSMAGKADFTDLYFEEIHSNDITTAIETYVQATHTDILAMTTHQRTLFERVFKKSKTAAIAHHTTIPLLAIRKPGV